MLALEGEHDLATAGSVRESIEEAGRSPVVVDLRPTQFVDSSILGVLVEASKRAEERECGFAIVLDPNANAAVRRVFEVTGLAGILPTFASMEDALTAVKDGSGLPH